MKKTLISTAMSLAACAAFADITVSVDTVDSSGAGVINFVNPNITLTITDSWSEAWYSPRVNFDSGYIYHEGDKVSVYLNDGATYTTSTTLFGNNDTSKSNADIYITGEGKVYSTNASMSFTNSRSKLFLDAYSDLNNVALTLGSGTNMTVSNTLILKTLALNAGATLRMASDADSAANVSAVGAAFAIRGNLVQEAGLFTSDTVTTQVYGTLDVGVEKGYRTRYLTVFNGSTIIIRANNAIMQSESVYRIYALNANTTTALKLYANQRFSSLWFASDGGNSVVNAYTNGYELTFSGIHETGTLNIFIEDGYDWANDKIHITSATVEDVTALIGKIQIGDVVVDESLWDITSDGGSGVYVNLVSVPEPAAWAAIFGVAALALAAFRRRK